ncbi:MAG: hypothetical protein WCI21_04205 [Alphaproteobacteria bacterium]
MVQPSDLRCWICGVIVAALILSPAMAQQATPGAGDVTTVSPLTVTGGLPKVGEGATLFTPQVLEAAAAAARQEHLQTRDVARDCGASTALGGPTPEDMGEFSIGALSATESRAQYNLEQAATAASAATDAALSAASRAARGEIVQADLAKAELARQAATKAYQDADKAAMEAHYRTQDLLELAYMFSAGDFSRMTALDYRALQPQVDYRTQQRAQNGGHSVIYTPAEYADLRLAKVVARNAQVNGAKAIVVTGKIVNPRSRAISVPPLWIELLDAHGTSLKAVQIVPPRGQGKIASRDSLAFTYAMTAVPEATAKASVTFAPSNRRTTYLGPEMACQTR